jgi:glyoxylase-like metal-dependent hydrolase (beta-lactamase superfamily II)
VPLPLPNDGLRAVNVYVLTHDDGLVLIDAGWAIAEGRAALDAALEALGASVKDVRRFLVTHVHRDHYTQAVHLGREFGTRVSLGAGERPSLEVTMRQDRAPLAEQLGMLRLLGAGQLADAFAAIAGVRPQRADWELPDDWLQDGDEVRHGGRNLQVVATPGHTRGHVVFHATESLLLFAGDHVLATITPSIGFEPVLSANPLGDFLGSLALIRQRPDALLLPAHGPVAASVHARVDELIAHHGARLDETEAAVTRGARSAYEVAAQLRWTRRGRELSELDLLNQMLAVTETAAHLELLVAQGRLARIDVDRLRCYLNG